MKALYLPIISISILLLQSCSSSRNSTRSATDTHNTAIKSRVVIKHKVAPRNINTRNVPADSVVRFAESLEGYPYKYGGSDCSKGFDCSGLINYSFKKFKISAPRTSVEYTNAGKEVSIVDCRRGDLILFTGSDASSGRVGHIGMITENEKGRIRFIHAASGESSGVIISSMNTYFVQRFVKVIRVFAQI
jgi:cell wall-associated NlpC family hydrolase